MTKKSIITICLLFSTVLNSQILHWSKSFGGISADLGNTIGVDASGNIYTTGGFIGTVDFDSGTGTNIINSAGGIDVFVQKMDALGNFIWAKAFGGSSDDKGYSFVDTLGNIYTTGYFNATVDFDPGSGTAILNSAGGSDIFVQKMDAMGSLMWVKRFGGAADDMGRSICVDFAGNIYTVGYFSGTVDFDSGVGTSFLTSNGSRDIFVQKLDSDGNFLWAKAFGGNSIEMAESIFVDVSGNVYTTGYFSGTADFDPDGVANITSSGSNDVFIQKMDSSGNFLWAKTFGGVNDDRGYSICVDDLGNVYTIGFFQLTVDFDPGPGITSVTSHGSLDVFIQKMDALGNFLWVKSFNGTSADFGFSIRVDSAGNIFTTGSFSGTIDFDPGTGEVILTTNGGRDGFIHKMDNSGNFIWVSTFGSNDDDYGFSICVDHFENVYATGWFSGIADFDPGPGVNYLSSAGEYDVFVLKMSSDIAGYVEMGAGIHLVAYPNPSNGLVQISLEGHLSNVEVTVSDFNGKIVYTKKMNALFKEQISFEGTAGTYYLTVKSSEGRKVVKLIKE
jgi:hypothetical protein